MNWSKYPHGEPPYQPELWNNKQNIKASHNCYTYMLNDLYKVPRIYGKPQPGHYKKSNYGKGKSSYERLNCKEVKTAVVADNPHLKILSLHDGNTFRCPSNYYKGFMMVSPGNDYHFARQDNKMLTVYRKIHNDLLKKKIKLSYNQNQTIELFLKYVKKHIPEVYNLEKQIYKSKTLKESLRNINKLSKTWSHKPGGTDVTDKDADGKLILNPEKANWNYSNKGGINYNKMCCYYSIPSNNIAYTFSSGIPYNTNSNVKNNPLNVRNNLSVNINLDNKYEKLLSEVCK